MRRAGLAIAVGDAVPEVKEAAHYITKALAGHGAVRDPSHSLFDLSGLLFHNEFSPFLLIPVTVFLRNVGY